MIWWMVALSFIAGWVTSAYVFSRRARKLSNELVSHLAECDRLHAEMDEQLRRLSK